MGCDKPAASDPADFGRLLLLSSINELGVFRAKAVHCLWLDEA
jgi:hypothetical protein